MFNAVDCPHPLELIHSVLHAQSAVTSSKLLSVLLGVPVPKYALPFLLDLESNLKALVKTPENCYLGIYL